jgi:hypothetical protein
MKHRMHQITDSPSSTADRRHVLTLGVSLAAGILLCSRRTEAQSDGSRDPKTLYSLAEQGDAAKATLVNVVASGIEGAQAADSGFRERQTGIVRSVSATLRGIKPQLQIDYVGPEQYPLASKCSAVVCRSIPRPK